MHAPAQLSLSGLPQAKPQTHSSVNHSRMGLCTSTTGQPELDDNGYLSLRHSSPVILGCGKLTIKADRHREQDFMSPEPWIMGEK